MPSVRGAVLYSVLGKYSLSILGLLTTIVVARLLTPAEIGLFAIASALVMILSEVRQLGAGVYLVREPELTEQKVRQALALTLIISWSLGLVVFLLAPFLARFYDQPDILWLFWILSLSFIAAPFISTPAALLTRALAFDVLFKIRLATSVTSLLATIILVALGFSYFGLALATTLSMLVQLITTVALAPVNMAWRPYFKGLKPIISVGVFTSAANLLKRGPTTLPDMIIGKFGTPTQVGLFSRGLGFIEFLFQTLVMGVSPVALPYLAKVKREAGHLPGAYTQALVLLTGLLWPVLAVASIVSLPMLRLFFGPQWDAAAPIAAIMAYWAMLRSGHAFFQQAMVSVLQEKLLAMKEAITFTCYAVALVLAAPLGLTAIAVTMLAVAVVDYALSSGFLYWRFGLSPWAFQLAMLPSYATTLLCGLAAWLIYSVTLSYYFSEMLALFVVSVLLPFIWVASLWLFRHPLITEIKGGFQAVLGHFNKRHSHD